MGSQISADDLGLTLEYLQFTMDAERQVARPVIDRPGKLSAVTNAMREQIAALFSRRHPLASGLPS